MAFERTRDVLDKARAFHHELAQFYEGLENVTEKERVRMLLDYLRRHEIAMESGLKDFEQGASKSVLDMWFKYTPEAVHEALSRIRLRPDMTGPEVIALALQLDGHLLEMYRNAALMAPADEVRELFASLYEEGLKERARVVRDVYEPE